MCSGVVVVAEKLLRVISVLVHPSGKIQVTRTEAGTVVVEVVVVRLTGAENVSSDDSAFRLHPAHAGSENMVLTDAREVARMDAA